MIYFILAKDATKEKKFVVKIGRSYDTNERISGLQIGNHCELELIESVECNFSAKLENDMHKLCERHSLRGEWFEFTKSELDMYIMIARQMASVLYNIEEEVVVPIKKVSKKVIVEEEKCEELDSESECESSYEFSDLESDGEISNHKFYCKHCRYKTDLKYNLDRHNRSDKHIETVKQFYKFVCKHCGIIFNTANKMYYHVKNFKHKSKTKSKIKSSNAITHIEIVEEPVENNVVNDVSNADLLNLANNINDNSREMTEIARMLIQKVVDNDNKPKK
jgi:hypothetical protein